MEDKWKNILLSFVDSLSFAMDTRDYITAGHSKRVSLYAKQVGIQLELDSNTLELLKISGLLHDIGKIGVPESILFKSAKLSEEEFKIIKKHPTVGSKIISRIFFLTIFNKLPLIIRTHHEMLDGSGYPEGYKRDEIPIEAQIISVCDIFDAISSRRQYHTRKNIFEVLNILNTESETKLNKEIVSAFLSIKLDLILKISELDKNLDSKIDQLSSLSLNDLKSDHPMLGLFNFYYSTEYQVKSIQDKLTEYQKKRGEWVD